MTNRMYRSAVLRAGCALSALSAALPAFAQDAPADAAPQAYHDQRADIIVTAIIPRRQGDILSGTSVVSGQELTRSLRPTIGDTLARSEERRVGKECLSTGIFRWSP